MSAPNIAAQFDAVRGDLRAKARRMYAGLVLEAYRRVVLRTPVDTGRARGNWNISSGTPDGSVDESASDRTGAASVSEAASFARTLSIDDVTFIVNNLPYINALEKGHSQQAPVGMVAVTVEEVRLIAQEITAVLSRQGVR